MAFYYYTNRRILALIIMKKFVNLCLHFLKKIQNSNTRHLAAILGYIEPKDHPSL